MQLYFPLTSRTNLMEDCTLNLLLHSLYSLLGMDEEYSKVVMSPGHNSKFVDYAKVLHVTYRMNVMLVSINIIPQYVQCRYSMRFTIFNGAIGKFSNKLTSKPAANVKVYVRTNFVRFMKATN